MTTSRPSKPWHVIPSKDGIKLTEGRHTSEQKAYGHVRDALRSGADTARVEHWEDGRWIHFDTMTADELPTPN